MFQVIDSRTGDADREYARYIQMGVPPKVVKEALPALVSGNAGLRQRADDFLRSAAVGHENDSAALARDNRLASQARQFLQSEMDAGSFAGEQMFRPGNRYAASEADLHAELDRQAPASHYPGSQGNAQRLTLGEMEAQAQSRHRRHDLTLHEDGRLTAPDGTVVERLDVPNFGPAPLAMHDTSPSRGGNGDGSTHYSKAETGSWDEYGQNRPYWLDED